MEHHQFKGLGQGHTAPKQNAKYLLDHKEHTTSLYRAIIYSLPKSLDVLIPIDILFNVMYTLFEDSLII